MVTREALAVLGAPLIDGSGGPPLDAATVVVEGERVTAVGPSSTTPVPPGVPTIDGRGRFLMPGLVDMHVHVHTRDKWHPEHFLAAGVTTVLDLGGQLADPSAYFPTVTSGSRHGPQNLFRGTMLQ